MSDQLCNVSVSDLAAFMDNQTNIIDQLTSNYKNSETGHLRDSDEVPVTSHYADTVHSPVNGVTIETTEEDQLDQQQSQ